MPLRRTDIDIFEHVTNTAYWHAIHEVMAHVPDVCTRARTARSSNTAGRSVRRGRQHPMGTPRRPDVHISLTVGDDVRAAALIAAL